MGYHSFVDEFERICREHIREGRARAFAFIFYNMTHGLVRSFVISCGTQHSQ